MDFIFVWRLFSFPCFQSLRLRILLVCLHIIVVVIIVPYSEWTAVAARSQLPKREHPWPMVLVHATRLVRNLSSAGTRARQELREEKDLVDCLVWIIRVGVKSGQFDDRVSLKKKKTFFWKVSINELIWSRNNLVCLFLRLIKRGKRRAFKYWVVLFLIV